MSQHEFWTKLPVFHENEEPNTGQVINNEELEQKLSRNKLPQGFIWSKIDPVSENLNEVVEFMEKNYLENEFSNQTIVYSEQYLRWSLYPAFGNSWITAIRVEKNNKIVGLIVGKTIRMKVFEDSSNFAQVDYLCVQRNLRNHKMAQILISEFTRYSNNQDQTIKGSVFCTSRDIGKKSLCETRAYHRPLNAKKLLDVNFFSLPLGVGIGIYNLPKKKTYNVRPLEEIDLPQLKILLGNYLTRFKIKMEFDLEQLKHYFMPREGIIYSFVFYDKNIGEITDFTSFFDFKTIMKDKNDKLVEIKIAHSLYSVNQTMERSDLLNEAFNLAIERGYDVYNTMDNWESKNLLDSLNFLKGNGETKWYLGNWKCPNILKSEIGITPI